MFDLTSSKLLLLGIIALLVVGPKDLPALLRTVGRYVGMIRRQASEFRAQFDEAIRESEFAEVKKEFETLGQETERSLREAEASVNQELDSIKSDVERTYADIAVTAGDGQVKTLGAPDAADEPVATALPAPDTAPAGSAEQAEAGQPVQPADEAPQAPKVAVAQGDLAAPAVAWPARPAGDTTSPAKSPERVEA